MKISYKQLSVAELVERIRKGDEYTFRYLFKTYYQSMVNISYRYVLDKQIAENITEDVFVKIWTNRKVWNVKDSIKNYLFQSVRNGSLNYLKHIKIEQIYTRAIKDNYGKVRTPYEDLVLKEFTEEIQQAIKELPKRAGKVFQMHRYDNLKYSEIAEILNISIGTVETHMVRALKFLRNRLSHLLSVRTTN